MNMYYVYNYCLICLAESSGVFIPLYEIYEELSSSQKLGWEERLKPVLMTFILV